MVKDQEYLEKKASYCLGLAKKLGATESSVIVNNSISETVNFRNKKLDESCNHNFKCIFRKTRFRV